MNKLILAALPLSLASCGLISLPPVSLPDQQVTVSQTMTASPATIYQQVLDTPAANVPVSEVQLQGMISATYPGGIEAMPATAELYVSTTAPSGCLNQSGMSICQAPQGALAGSATISGSATSFKLTSGEIVKGLKAGKLWIGVRLTDGTIPAGTTVNFTQMKGVAKI